MKPQPTTKQIWILTAMIFLLYVLLIPKNFVGVDGENWKNWSLYIFENGLAKAYNNADISYPPLYIYGLYFFTLLFDSAEKLLSHLYFTRIIALAFDFAAVAVLLKYIPAIKKLPIFVFFLLLNIAFIYNSLIWWQTDSIHTALVFISIIAALYHNITLSLLFWVLALNAKLSAVIYFPVLLLLLFPTIRFQSKKLFVAALLSIVAMLFIWYPFYAEGNINTWVAALQQRVNYYHFASMKAYNFWYLFLDENPRNVNDGVLAFNLVSYRTLGLIMFVVAFVAALFPLLKLTLQKLNAKTVFHEKEFGFIFLTLGLLTLVAFFFPTRIHERYAHAGVLFFFLHACYTGNFKLYILYSIAYFINLEKEAQFLLMPNEVDEFLKPEYVAVIYLLIGAAAFKKLYAKPSAA